MASQQDCVVNANQMGDAIKYDPSNYQTPININVRFEIMIGDTAINLNQQVGDDRNTSRRTNLHSINEDEDACTLPENISKNEKDDNIDLINTLIRRVCSNENQTSDSPQYLQEKDKDTSLQKKIHSDQSIFNLDNSNEEFISDDKKIISSISSQSNKFDNNVIQQNQTEENERIDIAPKTYSILANNHPPYQRINQDRYSHKSKSKDEILTSQSQKYRKSLSKRRRFLSSHNNASLSLLSRACRNDFCECDYMDRMMLDPLNNERERLIFEIIQGSPAANLTKYLDLPSGYEKSIPTGDTMISLYSQFDFEKSYLLSKQLMQSACWVLKDDPNSMSGFSLKQRFILSSIYFFTTIPTPSSNLQSTWAKDLNFLSDKHECLWNDEIYHSSNETYSTIAGVECLYSNKVSRLILGKTCSFDEFELNKLIVS